MIDIHVAISGTEQKHFHEVFLSSIAREPNITLHVIDPVIGNIGVMRKNGLSKGVNPYVGWVDPDDFIVNGIYTKLLNVIGDKSFAWANEERWSYRTPQQLNNPTVIKVPHVCHIIHRDLINFDTIAEDLGIMGHNKKVMEWSKNGVHLDEVGYVWRSYPESLARQQKFKGYFN